MKKYEVIKNHSDFNSIIQNGRYIKNKYFVIYSIDKDSYKPKFGIAISTKFGKAHIRNYYKRITRIFIDEYKKEFSNYKDYIIMIRKSCIDYKYNELLTYFEELIKEIKK